jgi:hypothetical protein
MADFKERAERSDRRAFRKKILSSVAAVCGYMFLMHLFVGYPEDWTVIDSCYFSITTVTTVGYGDISPTVFGGKLYLLFAAPLGVVLIGVSLHLLAVELIRIEEKIRHDIEQALEHAAVANAKSHLKSLKRSASQKINLNERIGIVSKIKKGIGLIEKCLPIDLMAVTVQQLLQVVGYLCVGALVLMKIEEDTQKLTFFDSLYCCVITLCSVGFGDISPQTQEGRLFSVFYIPVGVIILTNAIGTIAHRYSMAFHASPSGEKSQLGLLMTTLEDYGESGNGVITEADFMCAMLHTNKGVARQYLALIRAKFQVWDELDDTHEHGVAISVLMEALKEKFDDNDAEVEVGPYTEEGEKAEPAADKKVAKKERPRMSIGGGLIGGGVGIGTTRMPEDALQKVSFAKTKTVV